MATTNGWSWPQLPRHRERPAVDCPQLSCTMDVIEVATGRPLPVQCARCLIHLHTNLGRNTRLAGTWPATLTAYALCVHFPYKIGRIRLAATVVMAVAVLVRHCPYSKQWCDLYPNAVFHRPDILPLFHIRHIDSPLFAGVKVLNGKIFVGCEVLTALIMKSSVFWDIMPCTPLKVNWLFGGI
jgi:hypothetical protein